MMLIYNIAEVFALKMVRKQTYITEEQDRALKQLAQRYDTTEADIVRRAVEQWLIKEQAAVYGDPFAQLISAFDGPGESDHDDIYR